MIPSSPLAGLLVGLLDGLVVAALVLLAVMLDNRRRRRHLDTRQDDTEPTGADAGEESHEVPHAA